MAKDNVKVSDEKLIGILSAERQNAVGFLDTGSDDLSRQRTKALEYVKGEMKDIPSLPGRSSATDSTTSDTIETVLPDLMEIYTNEDIVSFAPQGDEDVEAAQQETDYIRHVIWAENQGWRNLYTSFKDSLTVKLGVWKFWWEEEDEVDRKEFKSVDPEELAAFELGKNDTIEDEESNEDGTVSFTLVRTTKRGGAKFMPVNPSDFAAAEDTVDIKDTSYCVMRARPRAQQLIEMGIDADKVSQLSTSSNQDETEEFARDTVEETSYDGEDSSNMLRRVQTNEHYIRTDLDGDGIKIWKILTNADESVMLGEKEEMEMMPFATITPFPNPHRLIGMSMVDKTMEIQRIKTGVLRGSLDTIYFNMNQRVEISDDGSNEHTLSDALRNEPGMPIRSKSGQAVSPVKSGGSRVDFMAQLEYTAVMGEQRSGVIRNAQGLNPDALHDTASGANQQLTMSQKRTRMIARIFAETGFKDLCVGIHSLIRSHATGPMKKRLRNKVVELDPTAWGVQKDMQVDISTGGQLEAIGAVTSVMNMQEKIVELQGGANGSLLDEQGIYTTLNKFTDLLPIKGLSGVFKNPQDAPPQQEGQEGPTPEQMKAQADAQKGQAELQLKQQEAASKAQMSQAELQLKQQEAGAKAQLSQAELQMKQQEGEAKIIMMREESSQKLLLGRQKAETEAALALKAHEDNMQLQREQMALNAKNQEMVHISKLRPGGDLDK